jgi:hypothetical protein
MALSRCGHSSSRESKPSPHARQPSGLSPSIASYLVSHPTPTPPLTPNPFCQVAKLEAKKQKDFGKKKIAIAMASPPKPGTPRKSLAAKPGSDTSLLDNDYVIDIAEEEKEAVRENKLIRPRTRYRPTLCRSSLPPPDPVSSPHHLALSQQLCGSTIICPECVRVVGDGPMSTAGAATCGS